MGTEKTQKCRWRVSLAFSTWSHLYAGEDAGSLGMWAGHPLPMETEVSLSGKALLSGTTLADFLAGDSETMKV